MLLSALRHIFAPTRRLQRVRLFLCSFVLYIPWIPGEHRREICAVERVTAHFRGFEEDSRSEVVFWIDEWLIEFGFTVSLSRNMCGYHAAYSSYILPLTLACYRLGQSRDSDVVAEDHHMFYKCCFAAVWNSLDVPAPDDCISAINPKMAHRPMILPARFQPAWRHSQGVAELGYVLLPAPTWASGASPSRCSSSTSSTLYSRFLSWSRRR